MDLSLNGFNEGVATFEAAEGTAAGAPVRLTGNGAVGPCAAGDDFCGVARNVRGGFAAVQLAGYARLPFSGDAPQVGYRQLSASAGGGVQSAASGGRNLLVTDVDESAGTLGIIL
jgi:hypothetical protein